MSALLYKVCVTVQEMREDPSESACRSRLQTTLSCIGTLTLVGPPLEFLPYHQDDRFPCSMQKPKPDSRHLYAGHHPGSKQVSPGFILV